MRRVASRFLFSVRAVGLIYYYRFCPFLELRTGFFICFYAYSNFRLRLHPAPSSFLESSSSCDSVRIFPFWKWEQNALAFPSKQRSSCAVPETIHFMYTKTYRTAVVRLSGSFDVLFWPGSEYTVYGGAVPYHITRHVEQESQPEMRAKGKGALSQRPKSIFQKPPGSLSFRIW